MTTAHRPTFDPAVGKETQKGPAYHQRLLPAHTVLKVRKPGQGGDADAKRDLRAELLKAEAAHYAKLRGEKIEQDDDNDDATATTTTSTRQAGRIEHNEDSDETPEAKRRRILEESRDLDADSDGSDNNNNKDSDASSDEDSDEDSDDDSEDETAELMRELEKIKKERAAAKEKEEREKAAEEEAQREIDIARGNPLLNPKGAASFGTKRRWDDDVIFRNQARGVEEKGKKKEFVNDLLRSDFHKKFMSKYVR